MCGWRSESAPIRSSVRLFRRKAAFDGPYFGAMRRFLTCLALTSAVAVAGPPTGQAATRGCSNTYGGDVISATNVTCRRAKRVVRTWARRYKRDGRVNRTVLHFRCRDRSNSVEGLVVKCRRGVKRIQFYANVP